MLTQRNLATNAAATWPATGEQADDLKLAFLPLSHIFARTCDLYIWIACGNRLALAESRETVIDDCRQVRPSWINAVPYFYDKLCDLAGADESAAARLRELLGGRIRSCQCGGAAVRQSTFDFFWQCGVPLFPGYGLTEASPVVSVSAPNAVRWGAVGRPPAGVEVRLADDGEILTRGPHVMQGYWQDEKATAETIRDGWLHTGDLGAWDEQGLLQIRGRKKEMIVTATGHKFQPSRLEMLLVQDPRIEQAFVTGDQRGFPIALIVPQPLGAADDPCLAEELRQRIDACLTGLSPHEQIRHFAILPRPLSMDHGELTPKASLRRAEIARNWSAQLESLGRPADLRMTDASP
jgi:long-chain acyl-CoA synthetase